MATPKYQFRSLALEGISSSPTTNKAFQGSYLDRPLTDTSGQFTFSGPQGHFQKTSNPPKITELNGTAEKLIDKIDQLLRTAQSPEKRDKHLLYSPEKEPNSPTLNPKVAYSLPLNSSRSPHQFDESMNFDHESSVSPVKEKPLNAAPKISGGLNLIKKISESSSRDPLSNGGYFDKNLYSNKNLTKNMDLFSIEESMRASTFSTDRGVSNLPPVQEHKEVQDLKSRIDNLDEQLKALNTKGFNVDSKNNLTNSRIYSIPSQTALDKKDNSLYASSRFNSVERMKSSQPPKDFEKAKRSPLLFNQEGAIGYSNANSAGYKSVAIEPSVGKNGDVTDQICKTIDNLIHTYLFENQATPTATAVGQKRHQTPTIRSSYATSANAKYPMSSSKVLLTNPDDSSLGLRPSIRPSYKDQQPYQINTSTNNFQSSAERPLRSFEGFSGSQTQTRPRYIRPLLRGFLQQSGLDYTRFSMNNHSYTPQSNQFPSSASSMNNIAYKAEYFEPNSSQLYGKGANDRTTTPARDNAQDFNSTDRKMKKLTLKSKSSEEKEVEKNLLERDSIAQSKREEKYSDMPQTHEDLSKLDDHIGSKDNHNQEVHYYQETSDRYTNGKPRTQSSASNREETVKNARNGELRSSVDTTDNVGQRNLKNTADDGKAWGMAFKVPSSIFDDTESSFHFDEVEKKDSARPKEIFKLQKQENPNGLIWEIGNPLNEKGKPQKKHVINLSESIRRAEKKPIIAHSFAKADKLGI